ncbi:MAG: aconitase/3-isopropylmalate dehydratase large subunit family protein [Caldilineales bacterium]|nr:aconitase/3-isopropylmalate dehydratase large subunit family protein [Caldilineales bacterium]
MGMTFAEKALARAAGRDRAAAGDILDVRPDWVLSHDNTAAIARMFAQLGLARVRHPERLVITLDHAVPAPTTQHAANHAEIRRFVAEQGIIHFFEAGRGICHQVLSEEGLVWPGQVILGADSHTTHFGWLGAFGAGIGRSEVAALWATGELWLRVPETMRIELRGELPPGVTAKDLGLWLLQAIGADGGLYRAIEFTGPGVGRLSLESRMVLPNLMAEAGVKSAYMPPDEAVFSWLAERVVARCGGSIAHHYTKIADSALYPDPDAAYAAHLLVELDALEPAVACPHSPDHVKPLSEVAGARVHQAFLGTCTNGRLEDLAAAAAVLGHGTDRIHRLAPGTRLLVIPASSEVYRQALAAGYIETFLQAGAMIGTPGCGPCMGNHMGIPAPGEVVISSGNRNFRGRMGTAESEVYLANPAVVAASAVLGRIADPRELLDGRRSPNGHGGRRAVTVLPTGAAPLSPAPPCAETTARPPTGQQLTGRVWKYGDNVNTDVIFPGKYTYTLKTPAEWAQHALEDLDPTFAAHVQPGDIIVAGRNWGCGSSREQAVGCLVAAGVRVIIAASFARIYFRNAVNAGLLPIVCPEAVAVIMPGETVTVDLDRHLVLCQAGAFPFPPLSPSLRAIIAAGGLIPMLRARTAASREGEGQTTADNDISRRSVSVLAEPLSKHSG